MISYILHNSSKGTGLRPSIILATLHFSPTTSLSLSFEPPHDKTSKMACAPSEDSDLLGHPPSLIRVFTVRMNTAWVLSYPLSAQRRRWSDWADAQADLSLRWAQSSFVGFVMRQLIFILLFTSVINYANYFYTCLAVSVSFCCRHLLRPSFTLRSHCGLVISISQGSAVAQW